MVWMVIWLSGPMICRTRVWCASNPATGLARSRFQMTFSRFPRKKIPTVEDRCTNASAASRVVKTRETAQVSISLVGLFMCIEKTGPSMIIWKNSGVVTSAWIPAMKTEQF